MTSTATQTTSSTAAVLDGLRATTAEITRAEVEKLRLTIEWAVLNEVEPDDWYANYGEAFGDRGLPVAGAGAPLVSEFAAMEYAAALGMSTDAGKAYLGRALELRYRLPRLWARVVAGELPVWRAGRIADHTIAFAARVPRMWTGTSPRSRTRAPGRSWTAWSKRRWSGSTPRPRRPSAVQRPESRHFDIEIDQVSYDGTVHIDGEVDLADALDLEDAIRQGAQQLAALGVHRVPRRPPLDRRRRARPPPARPRPRHRHRHRRAPAAEWTCTCTSPKPPSAAPRRSAGAGPPGPRSASTRSASGAATPTPRSP